MITDIFLGVSILLNLIFIMYLANRKEKSQLHRIFLLDLVCATIWNVGLITQKIVCLYNPSVDPFIFENFTYIGAAFFPCMLLLTGIIFANTKVKLGFKHFLLLLPAIISLLVLWTNNFHHWFYITYSIERSGTQYGWFITPYTIYTYSYIAIGLIKLLRYSIKNSGFFSKQSLLIILGAFIPIVVNLLFFFDIVPASVYATPISFSFGFLVWFIAIFKFKFLKVTPIALQNIVDRISDSYIVINESNKIIDYNKTFIDTFLQKSGTLNIREKNINVLKNIVNDFNDINFQKLTDTVMLSEIEIKEIEKTFNIEITPIINKGSKIGTLILFKDITQHLHDLQEIKNKQDILIERDRLASLGQLIGGISHNLKTPIMSIAGAVEGLLDLVKEYEISVGNDTVTIEDHHEIASDMKEWLEKIKAHTSYMSDIITAVKGQASTLSSGANISFTISELMNRVNILMKHELKHALINFNINYETDTNTKITGDINSLVQVINNLITNAIQAYKDPTSQNIDFTVLEDNNNIIFAIQDYAMRNS